VSELNSSFPILRLIVIIKFFADLKSAIHKGKAHYPPTIMALIRPGCISLFYPAVFAFCARNAAMDIGFELKEVQVTPCSFDGIMHVALWFTAFCAGKFATGFKIYMNIELLAFGTKIY